MDHEEYKIRMPVHLTGGFPFTLEGGGGATTLPPLSQTSLEYSGTQQWFQGYNLALRGREMEFGLD
ncbi:hypothetical protein K435DRAFT_866198 [Dendrothele bispora CBS 962.96]|uniref:Uncharacterized protein n=1 Tax=Dendrothele bispora (strain CBS 962.96) TaxID=1314807 RepID=A0A4S8LHE1_DENBC|nr:hypothetical protein K435DRAFT_866198 [Dendrothele bispora CBS 962.96]